MEQKGEIKYSCDDYEAWDDGKRWELIEGVPFVMSPAPTSDHQRISLNLAALIHDYLRGKSCEVFTAPFDVRLSDDTVVQPDVSIICDPGKIDQKGCKGAPDMVVEILSPATMNLDRVTKFNKYLEAGVKEYWIIDPDSRNLSVHLLKEGEYFSRAYGDAERVPINILDACVISLAEVFPAKA